MRDVSDRTKRQLLEEIRVLRSRNAKLESIGHEIPDQKDAKLKPHTLQASQDNKELHNITHSSIHERKMKNKMMNRLRITDNLMLIGIGLTVFFWIIESVIHEFLLQDRNMIDQILRPDTNEIWMRSLVGFILISFSFYAQIILKQLRRAKVHLQQSHDELEFRIEDRTAELTKINENMQLEVTERNKAEEAVGDALNKSQQNQKQISALLDASRAVLNQYDFNQTARSIFDACKDLIGATSGYVALLSKDGDENEVLFLDPGELNCTVDPNLPMPVRGLRAEAYRNGKTVFDNEFSNGDFVKYLPKGHVHLGNVLFAPLVVDDRTVGLMGLANKPSGFTEVDARMATAFAEFAAIALQNSRTLQALRESENKFKSIFDNANDGILVAEPDTKKFFTANKMFCEMLGYSLKEIENIGISDIHPEEDLPYVIEQFEKQLKNECTVAVNIPVKRKDGSVFYADVNSSLITLAGKPRLMGIFRDITERKRVEEILRESEERYRSLYSAINEGMALHELIYDKSGEPTDYRILDVNPAFESILGIKSENAIGAKASEVYGTGEAPYLEIYTKVATSGEPVNFETTFEPMGKAFRIVTFSPGKGKFATLFADITESKQAEEKLLQSEERFKLLFESAPDAYYIHNLEGNFVDGNKAAEELIGYSREEALGENFFEMDLLAEEDIPKVTVAMADNKDGKPAGPLELTIYRKDGSKVMVETRSYPVEIGGQTVVLGIARDITDRK
ncbi:MAG: PAS domain S-box protein, partial [Planctomycetota bacterium]